MFDFFDKLENKRAFKKALKEIQQEGNVSNSATSVSRVYSNETSNISSGGNGGFSPKYSDGLVKPDSEVVDMKNFKDWRKVERVESNHPVYKDKLFASSLKNSSSKPTDKVEPATEMSIDDNTQESIIDYLHDDEEAQDRKARNDFMSYMMKKSNPPVDEAKQPEQNKPKETKNQFTLLYEEMQRRKAEAAKKEAEKAEALKQSEVKSEPVATPAPVEPVKQKPEIVQVVEIAQEKKEVKKVNRKPRGKNKRRFDADVIGSVDWR